MEVSNQEMIIRRARLVEVMGPNDDRSRVRILPEMAEIETNVLPCYPPFFKGEVIVGSTEKNATKSDPALEVWVICTPSFRSGFVMGVASRYTGFASKHAYSYNFDAFVKAISSRGVTPKGLKYENFVVTHWNARSIMGIDRTTGDVFTVLHNGTMSVIGESVVYFRVGADSDAYSSIRMTRESISIETPKLDIKAKEVSFGKTGIALAGIVGGSFSSEGRSIVPIDGVHG